MSEIDLKAKFPNLQPIKSPPTLFTFNGIGLTLYGRRDADAETGTHVGTWCLALLFVPVLFLRAFRVAPAANGGWYFIGREPLSRAASTWNRVLLTLVLATAAALSYQAYTSTPGYQAKRQMAQARKHVERGELASAGRVYRRLAETGAERSADATAALVALLGEPCQQAPLAEAAGVYEAAAHVARRRQNPTPSDVAARGTALAAARGDGDPAGGIAVLDAVRPLVLDTREIDERRLALLRKRAEREPDNLDVVVPLASLIAAQQDSLAEAKRLLLPVRERLGDGEGARVLGSILARDGDLDGAHALLWRYVEPRLERLRAAEREWDATLDRLQTREIELLNANAAPAGFYRDYDSAGEDARRAMVSEYIGDRMRTDATYVAAQEALRSEAAVVPVALDLGMVSLQRAHEQPDADARKTQLQAAEQVFLAVRGIAGDSDEFRLSLGEVYYWLGKQDEGRKLFDEFLAGNQRSFAAILQIARRLRQLGSDGDARALAEEAYGKAGKAEERHLAAAMRTALATDNDDRIEWLGKADTSDAAVKAGLEKALGDRAMEAGRDDEAAAHYRAAVEAQERLPRSASTLNETALACYGIFRAAGDQQALARCFDLFQQAADLSPTDSILLNNAGATLLEGALYDVAGREVDLRALRETASFSTLGHLYQDASGRAEVVRRVREHPGVARAIAFLDKVTVIAPKNADPFATLSAIHQFTRDEAALRRLEQRARAAGVDTSDALRLTKEFLAGAKDPQNLAKLDASRKRAAELVATLRPKGGVTAAIAMDELAELLMTGDLYTGTGDVAQAVALAEEAHRLAPSSRTSGTLMGALAARAGRDLRKSDPAFDALWQAHRRTVPPSYLLALALERPGPTRDAVLRHPDVGRVLDIVRSWRRQFPEGGSSSEWALLRVADPAEAERIAERLRSTPRARLETAIDVLLQPASVSTALESRWFHEAIGEPERAGAALNNVASLGVPVPAHP
jgi:tetratricopeptide (TPR) repeat protein